MSVNTENLITTAHGLARLAKIQEVSEALRRDGKHVSISLVFSHFAFSTKSSLDLDELYDIDPVDANDEAATSPVDVCQVQSFSVIENGQSVQKRDFTLSANFDIPEVVTGIKTILLYCGDHIVDNRTDEEKEADGAPFVETLLARDYDYHSSDLYDIFAYTRVLDETGTYQPNGISVGASVYGRSRIRVHFNYIIDDINAAEVISVEPNIYPYSSGYLSQRAFNEGIRRYEEALETYRMDWERFAKGQSPDYTFLAEAYAKSSARNIFIVQRNEIEEQGWGNTNLETYSGYNQDTYKGYTPTNYELSGYSRKTQESCMYFEDKFMKLCAWKHIDAETGETVTEELHVPVKIEALYYLRSGLPMSSNSEVNNYANKYVGVFSYYHVLRFAISIAIDGVIIHQVGEVCFLQDSNVMAPKVPGIGKLNVDTSLPAGMNDPVLDFGLLLEGLTIVSTGNKINLNMTQFAVRAQTGDTGSLNEQLVTTLEREYKAQGVGGGNTSVTFDYEMTEIGMYCYSGDEEIFSKMEPNFGAGNLVQQRSGSNLVAQFVQNNFEISDNEYAPGIKNLKTLTTVSLNSYGALPNTVSIFGDFPVISRAYNGTIDDKYGSSANGHVDAELLLDDLDNDYGLRILSDTKLYNCRAIIAANDLDANTINITNSTTYTLYLMYEGGCKKFALINAALLAMMITDLLGVAYIQMIRALRVDVNGSDVSVTLCVHYKSSSSGTTYKQKVVDVTTSATVQHPFGNSINKYVAISDTNGNIEVSTYSKPE